MITGNILVKKLCSELSYCIEEQKEFGIKRNVLKLIAKGKRNLSNKLYKSIESNINKTDKINSEIRIDKNINNPEVEENLVKKLNKDKIDVIIGGDKNYYVNLSDPEIKERYETLKNIPDQDIQKLYESFKKNKYHIIHPKNSGTDSLAHEAGHIKNFESGTLKERKIHLSANSPKTREEFEKSVIKERKYPYDEENNETTLKFDDSYGIKEGIRRYRKYKDIIREEKNASKKAISLLKDSGMKNDELRKSKEHLSKDLKTYKEGGKSYYKVPIYNRLTKKKKKS